MHQILQSYLRRLTNLSGSNRSILLLRLISEQCLDLHEFNYVTNQPSFELIKQLIARNSKIKVAQNVDSRDADNNKLVEKLKKLKRIEQFIFDERGAKDLYVGWPFVRGKFIDNTLVRAPLLFFPVELVQEENNWIIQLRKDVNITFNKSFLLGYSFFNKVPLDEELLETTFNDFDTDSTVFRTQLYELLKKSAVEVNFNQENYADQLKAFENFRRSELDDSEKTGRLKLFPEAILGIFPQAGSYLVPDYVNLIENEKIADLEAFFALRKRIDPEDETHAKFSDRLLEENTFTPFELDAYQERALGLVKKGNSMIVQGPPGTGKSQLISNLICDYIARGKNVLLVCQKRAALDVVYNRLKEKELHDFIGLVHDFKNDRKDIFLQIANQIERIDEYRQKNNSLDAIQLERTFQQASRKIDASVEELTEFKKILFDESECGKSVKELYLTSNPSDPFIALNQEYRYFDYHHLDGFKERLDRYLNYYFQFEGKNHFWADGQSFAQHTIKDLLEIKNTVNEVVEFSKTIEGEIHATLHQNADFESAELLANRLTELNQLITNLDNDRVFTYFKHIVKESPVDDDSWLLSQERTLLQCFKGHGPETSLSSDNLGRFQEALEHAINARKGLFSWIRWKLFSADKVFITRVLVANELKSNKEGFQVLLDRIDNRLNFEHVVSEMLRKKWLSGFPASFRKIDIQNWFFYQKLAFNTFELLQGLRPLESLVPFHKNERKTQIEILKELESILQKIPAKKSVWKYYLSDTQIRILTLGKVTPGSTIDSLRKDFDAIQEYHTLQAGFSSVERKLVDELIDQGGDSPSKEKVFSLLENSLALAWIDHIETKFPILRAVSSQKLEALVKTLNEAVEDKKNASSDILLLKSRERTYLELEYNRLNNLVTYRDLLHQVTKRRQIWPIRKVIANSSEELFKLLPCWMASPESASAIFPMQEMFDLVIFDEASQCFAEKAIPALYRGKQVVIAGDQQQLKPFDLYRVRWEEENQEDIPELEIDSLLDLARRYLPQTHLQGHYRSQALELIEFSNQNFYSGRLRMLPRFEKLDEKPVHYLHVEEGVWEKNINVQEAKKVVSLIFELWKKKPDKTLGVVTFNAKQQGLILDLIEQVREKRGLSLPETLFVKNIENVQGDERDIIVFSTAYAQDKSGRLHMKFGSLNQEGGENRLNVAITRAKEKIYVVASILPGQIRAEDLKNSGPKLLRSYLQYAWDITNGNWEPQINSSHGHKGDWYLRNKIGDPEFHRFEELKIQKTFQFSDLTVQEKGEDRGLIITDDEVFHESTSVKDAFVYYPSLLSSKKWSFTRVFSRSYWLDRESIQERLKIFLNRVSSNGEMKN